MERGSGGSGGSGGKRQTGKAALPDELRRRLDRAHGGLLRVHKALLDHERGRYERERGPVGSPGEFLQIVIHDPWFAWLRPVSELAVQIDEATSAREPADPQTAEALLKKAQELLAPAEQGDDFQRAYHRAIQDSPAVAMAHGEWKRGGEPRNEKKV
jgi:hypothetical protein